jgi:carbonic anhydrase
MERNLTIATKQKIGSARKIREPVENMLVSIGKKDDIPDCYKHTPIEKLLLYHNLNYPFGSYSNAEMLIVMCIDNRMKLHLPDNFSYIVRNGGAKINTVLFPLSFIVATTGAKTVAVIGHSDCRMRDLETHRLGFINGLTEQGWTKKRAETFFVEMKSSFAIKDVAGSVLADARTLRSRYSNLLVAPLYYSVEDKKLYRIKEDNRKNKINKRG